jgi:hypothetical protein
MSKRFKRIILLALIAGLAAGYSRLDESQKRYVKHLAKQAPYLPGRYYA